MEDVLALEAELGFSDHPKKELIWQIADSWYNTQSDGRSCGPAVDDYRIILTDLLKLVT